MKSKPYATVDTFSERVVKIARAIPRGKVTTYGRIAKAAGAGGQAARSITGILGKAYDRGVHDIPFHRIIYADRSVWTNTLHRVERMKLYKQEGIEIDADGKVRYFHDHIWQF